MWKYIVTYIIIIKTWGACPEPEIIYDEFGRIINTEKWTAVACLTSDTTNKEKVFDTRKEAVDFIKRGTGKKAQGWLPPINNGELANFKLDSVPLKQYDCTHPFTSITSVYCDPPQPNCNTATCQKCGKQWPSY